MAKADSMIAVNLLPLGPERGEDHRAWRRFEVETFVPITGRRFTVRVRARDTEHARALIEELGADCWFAQSARAA